MRRRQALAVAAWLAAGGRAAAQAPGAMPRAVLAWGADGCWVGSAGGELHRLAGATAEVPPVPTAQGVWAVHEGGRGLHRWRADGGSGWGAVAEAVLREPVHALAASADGDWALIAHGERVSLLDAHGALVKSYEGTDLAGRRRGRASWLSALPQRRSFAVAWPALGELWELLLDPRAPPIHDGLVHDYRLNEAIAAPGYLGVRRAPLGEPLPAFGFADPRVPWVAGALGDEAVAVVHLDVRRRIATLPVRVARVRGAALRQGVAGTEWWLPAVDGVEVWDSARWTRLARHELAAQVRALRVTAGGAVWAPAGAALSCWRGVQWQAVALPDGVPRAIGAAARGLLIGCAEPAALFALDDDGGVLRRWVLPRSVAIDGVAALP